MVAPKRPTALLATGMREDGCLTKFHNGSIHSHSPDA
jgi:hypothetical protein